MWLAHLLTLSRIPLALAFWIAAERPRWAFFIMATAGLTDIVDGAVARRARKRAEARGLPMPAGAGTWLDPLCDKIFVLSVLAATYVASKPSPYLVAAIAAREIILVPVAALYRLTPFLRARMTYDFRAGPIGKAATVAQFFAIGSVLLRHPSQVLLGALAGTVGVAAAVHYLRRGVLLARARPAEGALPGQSGR